MKRKIEKRQPKLKALLERTKIFKERVEDVEVTQIEYLRKLITKMWHIERFQIILTKSQEDWKKIKRK